MATTYRILGQQPATTQVITQAFISNKALTSNVATLTTNANHNITLVGTIVQVQGVDSTFDGTYVITSIPTGTTFTYNKTAANVTSTAVSPVGNATFTPITSGFTVSNKVIQNNIATLTTGAAHGLSAGDWVAVGIGDALYDNLGVKVLSVPTTTTFTYAVGTLNAATTAVSGGAIGRTSFQASLDIASTTADVASTLYIANASGGTQYYRIALRQANAGLANQWLAYDQAISANATVAFTTGISIANTDVITVQASSNLVTFTATGARIS